MAKFDKPFIELRLFLPADPAELERLRESSEMQRWLRDGLALMHRPTPGEREG